MLQLVRWALPPVLVVLFLAQLAPTACHQDERVALVDRAVEEETNTARELAKLEYSQLLNSVLREFYGKKVTEHEAEYSASYNISEKQLGSLWADFEKEKKRIQQKLLGIDIKPVKDKDKDKNKDKEVEAEVSKPMSFSPFSESLRKRVGEILHGYEHFLVNARNLITEFILNVVDKHVAVTSVPIPFDLTQSPRATSTPASIEEITDALKNTTIRVTRPDTAIPSGSSTPVTTIRGPPLPNLRAGDPFLATSATVPPLEDTTLHHGPYTVIPNVPADPGSPSSYDNSSESPEITPRAQIRPAPLPQLSAEERQEVKEREEKGNKALVGWFDNYRVEQIQALENARTVLGSPAPLAPSPIPSVPPTSPFPRPAVSSPVFVDSPTLTIHPRNNSLSEYADDHPAPQEPEAVSDDELMEALMDESKPKPLIPIPQFSALSQTPSSPFAQQSPNISPHQYGVPQFQSQPQLPKYVPENPHYQPTKLHPILRTESEPILRNPKSSPILPPVPHPAVSPETLADSRSLRKNSLRVRPYLEPEEPEPQPTNTSPIMLPRSRSTSVESEIPQERRVVGVERSGLRGSSSPTPAVREAFYRKELGSPLEPDSASKPKRELEVSDNFESELEAESQPGSDSERDSDLE